MELTSCNSLYTDLVHRLGLRLREQLLLMATKSPGSELKWVRIFQTSRLIMYANVSLLKARMTSNLNPRSDGTYTFHLS